MANITDYLLTLPQYLLPQHLLSAAAHRLSHLEQPALKNLLINVFIRRFAVNLDEAGRKAVTDYRHFNDFFTRELDPAARPLGVDLDGIIGPADGTISQIGRVEHDTIVQAKQRHFTLQALLGGEQAIAQRFLSGSFATIYLAPHNYHRVHAPCAGTVTRVIHIPGTLFSVNDRTARTVDQLFARNERVVVEIDSRSWGRVVLILVGALLVASVSLHCCTQSDPIRSSTREPARIAVDDAHARVKAGEELGWFNMGSTVIMLFERDRVEWQPELLTGSLVQVGQIFGQAKT